MVPHENSRRELQYCDLCPCRRPFPLDKLNHRLAHRFTPELALGFPRRGQGHPEWFLRVFTTESRIDPRKAAGRNKAGARSLTTGASGVRSHSISILRDTKGSHDPRSVGLRCATTAPRLASCHVLINPHEISNVGFICPLVIWTPLLDPAIFGKENTTSQIMTLGDAH